jgi:beta-glucosidase
MERRFPEGFIFGTSTAAAQIETAFDHDWHGVVARDGVVFDRTTDHEMRIGEDAEIISSLAPHYRMGIMWSKLQREPFGELDKEALDGYRTLLSDLNARGVKVMMVLHHFANPNWFCKAGHWEKSSSIDMWVDFARKLVDALGTHVSYWNTFNEPNVYASYGWLTGFFPPFKRSPIKAVQVVKNMAAAHNIVYDYIKLKFPASPVGISHNAVVFSRENWLGWFPAMLSDWWFMDYIPSHFEKVDFFGMSYYCRVSHDPMPITYIDTPEKIRQLGKRHDDMWEYYPEGMRQCIDRYWRRYRKPIIITESGVCDESDVLRRQAIHDYARIVHKAIEDGIDVKGYFWWSTWDNFEWHLGPSRKFGLYACDPETKARHPRASAAVFRQLAHSKTLTDAEQVAL